MIKSILIFNKPADKFCNQDRYNVPKIIPLKQAYFFPVSQFIKTTSNWFTKYTRNTIHTIETQNSQFRIQL